MYWPVLARRSKKCAGPVGQCLCWGLPSLWYDHISCDGQCFLFVRSLTNDHPSNATNDRVRWDFLPRERPLWVQCISKNRGWHFNNIRSQWWIITMLRSDTFVQLPWTFFYFGDTTTTFADLRRPPTLHRHNVASPPVLRHLCNNSIIQMLWSRHRAVIINGCATSSLL